MKAWCSSLPQNYYDLQDNLDLLETRCDLFEKSEQSLFKLSELFRQYGDSEFADLLYHKFYMSQEQYEKDCELIKIYKNQINYYKELN